MQKATLESTEGAATGTGSRGTVTTDGGEVDPIDLDTMFHILRSGRRRLFLEYLRTNGGGDFREIAEFVAGGEYGPDYDKDERKRVYISLYQNHVEDMDDAGLIQWNGTGGEVHPGENFQEVAEFLKCIHKIHGGEDYMSDGYDPDDRSASIDGNGSSNDEQEQPKEGVARRLLDRLK